MGSTKDIEFDAIISLGGEVSYEHDAEDETEIKALIQRMEDGQPGAALNASAVADAIVRALGPQLRRLARSVVVPPDDAYVDQDSGLLDREVYLRLARRGRFPNQKVGNKRVARWADVKAAFIDSGKQVAVVEPTDDPQADLLNEIRQRAGLQIKGGR